MAVTKIWDVRGSVLTVTRYTANEEKTWNGAYGTAASFHKVETTVGTVMEYTADQMKTEKQLFVTGINCSDEPKIAAKQFNHTKELYKKTGGIVCYHAYQSFARGEVTAAEAHQIGVELAKELWGDRFEVLVSTHCNTGVYHNHFVLNSVSFTDGLRYYDQKATYQLLRDTSDRICREHHLSVVRTQNRMSKSIAGLGDVENAGKYTIRSYIKNDIDLCIASHPNDFEDFMKLMIARGYSLERRGSFLRVKPKGGGKFWRLDRLGDAYSEYDIKERIREQWYSPRDYGFRVYKPQGIKPTGLHALYIHYCYLLGVFPKVYPDNNDCIETMKADKLRMEMYSDEAKMLGKYSINTFAELEAHYAEVVGDYKTLSSERMALRNKMRHMNEEEAKPIKAEVISISAKLKELRREKELCLDVAQRSGGIEATVKLIEFPQERTNEIKEKQKERGESRE